MTTGQRGFGKPIEAFYWPRRTPQLVMIVHLFSALAVVGTLGALMQIPRCVLCRGRADGGRLPAVPRSQPRAGRTTGILVAFHQGVVLTITLAIVAVGH